MSEGESVIFILYIERSPHPLWLLMNETENALVAAGADRVVLERQTKIVQAGVVDIDPDRFALSVRKHQPESLDCRLETEVDTVFDFRIVNGSYFPARPDAVVQQRVGADFGYFDHWRPNKKKRARRIELPTSSLGSLHSTAELRPLIVSSVGI